MPRFLHIKSLLTKLRSNDRVISELNNILGSFLLRGSSASTLIPDLDNANVGIIAIIGYTYYNICVPCFFGGQNGIHNSNGRREKRHIYEGNGDCLQKREVRKGRAYVLYGSGKGHHSLQQAPYLNRAERSRLHA